MTGARAASLRFARGLRFRLALSYVLFFTVCWCCWASSSGRP